MKSEFFRKIRQDNIKTRVEKKQKFGAKGIVYCFFALKGTKSLLEYLSPR